MHKLKTVGYQYCRNDVPNLALHGTNEWVPQALSSKIILEKYPQTRNPLRENDTAKVRPALVNERFTPTDVSIFHPYPNINTKGMDRGHRPPLDILTFENVYFLYDDTGYAIFDETGVSRHSRTLPSFSVSNVQAETIEKGFFAGDRFNQPNICHGVLDHAGRALLAGHCGVRTEHVIFPESGYEYVRTIRERLLVGSREIPSKTPFFFKELSFLADSGSPDYRHPARVCDRRTIKPLASAFAKDGLADPASPKKIYISRADASLRRIENEAGIAAMLESQGFVSVVMTGKSGLEQARLFHNADVIVTPHGAALTSLLFCRPGTEVVEIHNAQRGTAAFFLLAQAIGVKYKAVFGYQMPPNLAVSRGNYIVSLADVKAAISGSFV